MHPARLVMPLDQKGLNSEELINVPLRVGKKKKKKKKGWWGLSCWPGSAHHGPFDLRPWNRVCTCLCCYLQAGTGKAIALPKVLRKSVEVEPQN